MGLQCRFGELPQIVFPATACRCRARGLERAIDIGATKEREVATFASRMADPRERGAFWPELNKYIMYNPLPCKAMPALGSSDLQRIQSSNRNPENAQFIDIDVRLVERDLNLFNLDGG